MRGDGRFCWGREPAAGLAPVAVYTSSATTGEPALPKKSVGGVSDPEAPW
jgi:hypothetical protein